MPINTFTYEIEFTPKRPGAHAQVSGPCYTLALARELAIAIRDGRDGQQYSRILIWARDNHPLADRQPSPVFVAKS